MGLTLDDVKKLVEAEEIKYFLAPDRPVLMMGFGGINGSHQISLSLQVDGTFLQLRTAGYASCPADHPHVDAVLRVLAHLNYDLRLAKFAWDVTDGEICAYADMWVADGTVTQDQLHHMFGTLLPAIDLNHPRITKTIETGEDPGEANLTDLTGGLPPELRELLEKLAKAAKEGGDSNDEDEFSTV